MGLDAEELRKEVLQLLQLAESNTDLSAGEVYFRLALLHQDLALEARDNEKANNLLRR